MILRSVDGSVELCGTRMGIGIPASGDARYILDGGLGGYLNVSWLHSPCVQEQSGRVILEVADGKGGSDELVITSPRTLEIAADGTAFDCCEAGRAEVRIAELEKTVAAHPENVTISDEGTGPSGEGE